MASLTVSLKQSNNLYFSKIITPPPTSILVHYGPPKDTGLIMEMEEIPFSVPSWSVPLLLAGSHNYLEVEKTFGNSFCVVYSNQENDHGKR